MIYGGKHWRVAFGVAAGVVAIGCGGHTVVGHDPEGSGGASMGGTPSSGGTDTGGKLTDTGGRRTDTGGRRSTGGVGTGGTPSSGATDAGGTPSSGGTDTGGKPSTGGVGTGGTPDEDLAGAWFAFDAQPDETRGIYLMSASIQCFDRITPEGVTAKQPAFSSDGKLVAYAAQVDGTYQIFTRELSTGSERQITDLPAGATYPTFAPNGFALAFVTGDPEAFRDGVSPDSSDMGDLMELDFKSLEPRLVAARDEEYPYFAPAFSGDDRLFVSNSYAIFAFYRGPEGTWPTKRSVTSPGVPEEPAPSPDGQWLAYPDTCSDTLTLYKHRIDVGSSRSCVGGRGFRRDMGIIAPDWGAFGFIAAEYLGPAHGLALWDEKDLSRGPALGTPKLARNPSWGPSDYKRACRL